MITDLNKPKPLGYDLDLSELVFAFLYLIMLSKCFCFVDLISTALGFFRSKHLFNMMVAPWKA